MPRPSLYPEPPAPLPGKPVPHAPVPVSHAPRPKLPNGAAPLTQGIVWDEVPELLKEHLMKRVREGRISAEDLQRLKDWIRFGAKAPVGDWYKVFFSFTLAGTGCFPKTILEPWMEPWGQRLAVLKKATTQAEIDDEKARLL